MYLSYVNDFITVSAFAAYYMISEELASQIINEGRELHELNVKATKFFKNEN